MPDPLAGAPPRDRAAVPDDPRDLPGDFPCRREIEIRIADTDAMGHVNNASYLTYFEMARVGYWEAATGEPLPLGVHGAEEGLILADIRVAFRSPALYGERLVVETRVTRLGRTSIGMEHRLTAPVTRLAPGRLVAVAESVLVTYDYSAARPVAVPEQVLAAIERLEGRTFRGGAAGPADAVG